MSIEAKPATAAQFDDVATMLGPKTLTLVCWCSYAWSRGAPAIEGYPVDNRGEKVGRTMAYVGTHALFERVGFTKAADTSSVSGGFPRVLMRLDLH